MSESGLLVLNAGSSSVKFAVFTINGVVVSKSLARGQVSGIGSATFFSFTLNGIDKTESVNEIDNHEAAIEYIINCIKEKLLGVVLVGVGHRVVHGGQDFSKPSLVTDDLISDLKCLIPLAPQHQPHNIAAIEAVKVFDENLRQVACFDTSFHSTQAVEAKLVPLPIALRNQGIQRYGFHGLSYEYITGSFEKIINKKLPSKVLIAHLGNGASVCGVKDGKSIVTSMGFSTLDGLLMGTRSGAIDPGVLLKLMEDHGFGLNELKELLYSKSGLLGVSGISSDMRVLLESSDCSSSDAVNLFIFNLVKMIGSYIPVLNGLEAIIFTGGIGENAPVIREKVCEKFTWLGLELDKSNNCQNSLTISSKKSAVDVYVLPTNEELVIAQHTCNVLGLA
jgi:acetate kinase